MKNGKEILIIILTIIFITTLGIVIFIINDKDKAELMGTTEEIFEEKLEDIIYTNLYAFFLNIQEGNYDDAYKVISQASRENLFEQKEELAIYSIDNFLTSDGEIKPFTIQKTIETIKYEYLIQVNVKEDDETETIYDIVMNIIGGAENSQDYNITFQ